MRFTWEFHIVFCIFIQKTQIYLNSVAVRAKSIPLLPFHSTKDPIPVKPLFPIPSSTIKAIKDLLGNFILCFVFLYKRQQFISVAVSAKSIPLLPFHSMKYPIPVQPLFSHSILYHQSHQRFTSKFHIVFHILNKRLKFISMLWQ